jgi:predicted nicotinamide N-methyase
MSLSNYLLLNSPKVMQAAEVVTSMQVFVDVLYAAPQAHRIVNVALHWEYSPGIIFIFSQGRKNLYHV